MIKNENDEGYFLVPKALLQSIEKNSNKILSLLEGEKTANSLLGDYISETDAKKLLGKKTTWFWNMRTNGKLAFSKVGGTNFYNKNDIIKLLENNRHDDT
ncbi:MAG: helix-turn-helix domain-containing protein [Bacteroidetes bacterium]|nr:helix-turn-helix domain-containing protein [Bacteroidota bacterium]